MLPCEIIILRNDNFIFTNGENENITVRVNRVERRVARSMVQTNSPEDPD